MGGTGTPVATVGTIDVARTLSRIATCEPLSLRFTPLDDDGDVIELVGPTVTVSDAHGTVVTTATPSLDLDGSLSVVLDANDVTLLGTYRVDWGGRAGGILRTWPTFLELVGGHVFAVAELRAHDSAYADAVKYPASTIREKRIMAEQRFEGAAGVAYVPRGRAERIIADGHQRLMLSMPALREVYSVSIDGTALTEAEVAELLLYEDGRVHRDDGWPAGSVVDIHYSHGYDLPAGPVMVAVMLLAKQYLVPSTLSSRATTESTDVGFIRYSIATRGGKTGIPEVDAIAWDYGRNRPVIA